MAGGFERFSSSAFDADDRAIISGERMRKRAEALDAQEYLASQGLAVSPSAVAMEGGDPTQTAYGRAAADFDAMAEEQGVPSMIRRAPVDPAALKDPRGDAEFARQFMSNPEQAMLYLQGPQPPRRGVGEVDPLRGVRDQSREAYGDLSDAQRSSAEIQAGGFGQAAQMVADSRARVQQETLRAQESMEARAQAERSFAMDQRRREETKRATAANIESDIQRRAEEIKNTKIDPNNFYRGEDGEIDWGTKVGASIAMALGAMGSAFTGGPNFAQQIIENAIDRDMRSQAANLANQRDSLAEKKSSLARYMDQFSDSRSAFEASQGNLRMAYADQIEAAKQGIQDENQLRSLDLEMNRLRTEGSALIGRAAEREAELQIQSAEKEAQFIGASESIKTQRTQRAATRQGMAMQRAEAGAPAESGLPPGYEGNPPNKEALKEVVSMAGTGEDFIEALNRLQNHVREEGVTLPFTDADARGKAMATDLQMISKDMYNLGVLSGPDMELLEKVIPGDPGALRQGQVKAKLEQAKETALRKLNNYMKARGVRRTASEADNYVVKD